MKTGLTRLKVLALALAGGVGLGAFNAPANLEVSAAVQINAAADFYDPLAPSGTWVEVDDFGRCWHPSGVAVDWRPYCDGTWVWTDCGWYWQSDEPWAWACYHYGSWTYHPHYGWLWVPGVEWAPAWVYWRTGGDYIGWAPCSPRGAVVVSGAFVFVDEHHFHERHRPSTVIVNNVNIFNDTRQIGESRHESRNIGGQQKSVVVNSGPDVNNLEKVTGRKFAAVSVQEADRRTVVPPTARHERQGSPAGGKSPAVQDQARPVPERDHNLPPGELPERPGKPVPPDRNLPPVKPEITPPVQPPSHEMPPHQIPSHEVPPPQAPSHEVPPHPVSPHEMPKTSPSAPPSKHEATPQPPSAPVPPARPEENENQGPGHEKDKDRQ